MSLKVFEILNAHAIYFLIPASFSIDNKFKYLESNRFLIGVMNSGAALGRWTHCNSGWGGGRVIITPVNEHRISNIT